MNSFHLWPIIVLALWAGAAVIWLIRLVMAVRRADRSSEFRRRPMVRLLFAVIGVALVSILAIESLTPSPTISPTAAFTATVPVSWATASPPVTTDERVQHAVVPLESGRFILHAIIMRSSPSSSKVIGYAEGDYVWPRDRGQILRTRLWGWSEARKPALVSLSFGSQVRTLEFRIDDVRGMTPAAPPAEVTAMLTWAIQGISARVEDSETRTITADGAVSQLRGGIDAPVNLLSLIREIPPEGSLVLYTSITPLALDEGTTTVPIQELLAHQGPGSLRASDQPKRSSNSANGRVPPRDENTARAPGLSFLLHFGAACISLVAAAALLAQAFEHRAVALCGIAAGALIMTAALERIVVDRDLRRLDDASCNATDRIEAGRRAYTSFFYRGSADRSIARLAADPTRSPIVSAWAVAARQQTAFDQRVTSPPSAGSSTPAK